MFKIGDRVAVAVTVVDGDFLSVGSVGTIIEIDANGYCVVEFDPGQSGVEYMGGITSTRSWYVLLHSLRHAPESQENTPWYETEEGKEWLSNQTGIEEQFMQGKQQRMPKRGDHYVYSDEEYVLAQPTNHEVCLIKLTTGNRWADPVKVVYPYAITEDEWSLICVGGEFTLVE